MHLDGFHIAANTLALVFFGFEIEAYCGNKFLYLFFILLMGIGGNILSAIFSPYSLSVGASSYLSGIFGLYLFKLFVELQKG